MKHLFNEYVQNLQTYIMVRIAQKTQELTPSLIEKNRKPIYLSIGAPTQAPPQFVIDKLTECINEEKIHTYSSPKGEEYYLEAISKRMKNRFGVELNPKSEISSLIGSKEGIANLIRALINPKFKDNEKEIILVPDPGYASYLEMIKVSGGKGYSIPLTYKNNYMPNMNDIWQKMKSEGYDEKKVKAIIINYPNNPLGATCTLNYMKELVKFCKQKNILLISDNAYSDLYFDGKNKPHSVLEVEGAKDVAVEFYSFSKPYAMTGWRLGWICGNENIVQGLAKLKSTIDTGLFKALQKAASQILNSNEGEKYIEKSNLDFKKKQEILIKGFTELGWNFNQINVPNATFYLWLPIPPRYKSAEDFTNDVLQTSGVVLVPGIGFGKYGEGFFRASFVCSNENLFSVIERLKKDGFYFEKH